MLEDSADRLEGRHVGGDVLDDLGVVEHELGQFCVLVATIIVAVVVVARLQAFGARGDGAEQRAHRGSGGV